MQGLKDEQIGLEREPCGMRLEVAQHDPDDLEPRDGAPRHPEGLRHLLDRRLVAVLLRVRDDVAQDLQLAIAGVRVGPLPA